MNSGKRRVKALALAVMVRDRTSGTLLGARNLKGQGRMMRWKQWFECRKSQRVVKEISNWLLESDLKPCSLNLNCHSCNICSVDWGHIVIGWNLTRFGIWLIISLAKFVHDCSAQICRAPEGRKKEVKIKTITVAIGAMPASGVYFYSRYSNFFLVNASNSTQF